MKLLTCSSMSGKLNMPLLMIGKSAIPRTFKNTLLAHYMSQKLAGWIAWLLKKGSHESGPTVFTS